MLHAFVSLLCCLVPFNLVITCWEGAGRLALSCVMFSCVPGQVWNLNVSLTVVVYAISTRQILKYIRSDKK